MANRTQSSRDESSKNSTVVTNEHAKLIEHLTEVKVKPGQEPGRGATNLRAKPGIARGSS